MKDLFDEAYEGDPTLFGAGPEPLLERFAQRLPPGRPVLDLGIGQGRNAFFLARRGLRIVGLDPSAVAIETTQAQAADGALPVEGIRTTFDRYDAPDGTFGGVLIFGLIPILRREELGPLAARTRRWLAPGGLAFATAFTTGDPAFARIARESERLGRGSFRRPDGTVRTYLDPGELPALMPGLELLHHAEGLGPEHRHGDGPVERHAVAEVVLRRVPDEPS